MGIIDHDIRSKSLRELEQVELDTTGEISSLIERCREFYQKPLKDFDVEDLRFMITQNIGLEFLIPIALEHLETNPFVEGDYYPGDLLNSILNVSRKFWEDHQDFYWRIYDITSSISEPIQILNKAILRFENNP